ncbi:unnamed protein product [Absidia cylindrospora]
MDFTCWLQNILQEKLEQDDQWSFVCRGMLQTDDDEKDITVDPVSLAYLQEQTEKVQQQNGIFAAGAITRPYYRAMAHTLKQCYENGGKLPSLLLEDPLNLLASKNTDRLENIQADLAAATLIAGSDDLDALKTFLFKKMRPEDWRVWLMMRTTIGSRDWKVMPPSLHECLIGFATLHQKKATTTTKTKRKNTQHHVLTVGAKALSKHWHRDRQVGFWGDCTGSDAAKNTHANTILIKILTNAVWINLHSLPHDQIVYEIREKQGYGVRWTNDLSDPLNTWLFRGFLEPQMENGHFVGWIH